MRGKIRDKNSTNKRNNTRRDEEELRRPYKRTSRSTNWVDQIEEDDYEYEFENYEDELDDTDDLTEVVPIYKES